MIIDYIDKNKYKEPDTSETPYRCDYFIIDVEELLVFIDNLKTNKNSIDN